MQDEDKIVIEVQWSKTSPDWYMRLKIKIINNTNVDYTSPEISFDVSNINYSQEAGIRAYDGLEQKTFSGDRITGNLSGSLNAYGEVVLIFGVNFLSTDQYPELPEYFWFNKEPLHIDTGLSGSCFDSFYECLGFGVPGYMPY